MSDEKDDKDKDRVSVTSYNQSGGITAHTVNVGPPRRQLTAKCAANLLSMLRRGSPIAVHAVTGDAEAMQYALQVKAYLQSQGFTVTGVDQVMLAVPSKGQSVNDTGTGFVVLIKHHP